MSMAAISPHKDPMIQGVLLRYALPYWIYRVPFHSIPFYLIGLEYSLCCFLYVSLTRLLLGVEIVVCGGGDLDIEANHVGFSRDNHDRAMVGMNGTF